MSFRQKLSARPRSALEQDVISALLADPNSFERARMLGITARTFEDADYRQMWSAAEQCVRAGAPPDPENLVRSGASVEVVRQLIVGASTLCLLSSGSELVELGIQTQLRLAITSALEGGEIEPHSLIARLNELCASRASVSIWDRTAPFKIDEKTQTLSQRVGIKLGDKIVATEGNLLNVIARAKVGKTAFVGGLVASALGTHVPLADTLGWKADNSASKAVLFIDTEQSANDAAICANRILKRSRLEKAPAWFYYYNLCGVAPRELRKVVRELCVAIKAKCGGLYLVAIDGVADLVDNVNDPTEAAEVVRELQCIATELSCIVATVIHGNEAMTSGDDGRGHLGKQLVRKGEANLVLKRSGKITKVSSEKQRHAPITEADGISFIWSDLQGMHVVNDSKANLAELAGRIFGSDRYLRWSCLHSRICELEQLSKNSAERRIKAFSELGVIRKTETNDYELVA